MTVHIEEAPCQGRGDINIGMSHPFLGFRFRLDVFFIYSLISGTGIHFAAIIKDGRHRIWMLYLIQVKTIIFRGK